MFNPTPFAAASIGQVHTAALGDDKTIAIKVQFPGVKESIQSDLDQMLTMMGVTMKKDSRGFHQNKDVFGAYKEAWLLECDYKLEADNLRKYTSYLRADTETGLTDHFDVPEVVDELSAERVLAMSFVSGTTIDQLCGSHVAQSVRDATAERLVRIKMKELFSWCFLNADPHLGNFVFNATTHKLGLLDFGFCKQFPRKSASHVAQLFLGCADADRDAAFGWFHKVGMVGPQDKEGWDQQLFEFYKFVFSPFHSDEPFAFKPWFDDPRMKGFMDGVSYQNAEWAKQEAVKYDDGSVRVVDPTLTLMCEYILQILLHCGRLRAVVSVRKYLVNAVAELRAREAAEPDE